MLSTSDTRITTPVPFLRDKTVLYVGERADGAELRGRFRDAGYKFLYLPDLAESLEPALLGYLFPGSEGSAAVGDMCRRIRELAGIGELTGFLYKRDGVTRFHAVPESTLEGNETDTERWIHSLGERPVAKAASIRFRRGSLAEAYCDDFEERSVVTYESLEYRPPRDIEEPLDARTLQILRAWEQIEQEFGITIEDLDIILGYRVKLSRLNITTAGKIFLMDWAGRPEVRMDDLTKAVYFFYLRHPEGAALKDLISYRAEILRYYAGITGRDDPKAIAESVDKLLCPLDNNLNVSISRIKKAFKDIVGERIAKSYYVDGRYAEVRRIALDRDLVIWEH